VAIAYGAEKSLIAVRAGKNQRYFAMKGHRKGAEPRNGKKKKKEDHSYELHLLEEKKTFASPYPFSGEEFGRRGARKKLRG